MNKIKINVGVVVTVFFGVVFTIAYTGNGHVYAGFLKHVPGGDKTGHVVLLCILAFASSWFGSFRFFRVGRVIFAVFVFITIEEFLQILSPNRTFDLLDLACNYVGITLAYLIAWRCEGNGIAAKGEVGG